MIKEEKYDISITYSPTTIKQNSCKLCTWAY